MPVPPYGSRDIPGSDIASKLIVNQPNGKVQAMATGVMNGLNPDTTYTVYLSNPYTLDTKRWDVTGTWVITVDNGAYPHDYTFTMTSLPDGTFTGIGGYPAGSSSYVFDEVVTDGKISGNTISFTANYYQNGVSTGYVYHATGTIAGNGTLSGTGDAGVYEWHSTSGKATYTLIGSGWTGLFNTQQPFTFTTDDTGSGSWHVNLRASDLRTGVNKLSVWINGAGATILVSDVFTVTV
jgi:hypothetical protein